MKKLALLVSLLLLSSLSYAGRYVCYDARYQDLDNNWVYSGCFKSSRRCGRNGTQHFGRYPNRRAQNRALKRCRRGTPRFID